MFTSPQERRKLKRPAAPTAAVEKQDKRSIVRDAVGACKSGMGGFEIFDELELGAYLILPISIGQWKFSAPMSSTRMSHRISLYSHHYTPLISAPRTYLAATAIAAKKTFMMGPRSVAKAMNQGQIQKACLLILILENTIC